MSLGILMLIMVGILVLENVAGYLLFHKDFKFDEDELEWREELLCKKAKEKD